MRWSIILASQREQGLQQIAETSVKGPSSQQGDGKPFLHLKKKKGCNRCPKHPSKDQARNKEIVNHPCIPERTSLATSGRNIPQRPRLATKRRYIILASQREEGLQQVAPTSFNGAGSQQGDGKSLSHLKENKVCNRLLKHQSKDQARNTDVVNPSCISKRTRLATHGRHIRQRPRLATRTW